MNFNYNIIVNRNDNKELVVKRCVSVLAFEVRKNIYYMILITSWFKNIIMGEWVTGRFRAPLRFLFVSIE